MFNKNKKAIKVLNDLLIEIDTISEEQSKIWKSKLKDTLNLYLGENSAISNKLDETTFTRIEVRTYSKAIGLYEIEIYDENKKEDFRNLIHNATNYIQSHGIYKNSNKTNFLTNYSNKELITGIVAAIGIILSIGIYLGKLEKDREILQIETKLKEIETQKETLKVENKMLKQISNNLTK